LFELDSFLQGGASGIGLSLALALSTLGATVHVFDLAASPPSSLSSQSNVHYTPSGDVTSRSACHDFISSISGRLDGLINCAGICPFEGKMASDELFRKIMDINVGGTWNMGTEAIQKMTGQDARKEKGVVQDAERTVGKGVIVNISSGAGMRGIPGIAAYCTSKHAVVGMTRAWAKDWGGEGIRVNAVAPGMFAITVSCGLWRKRS